MSLASPALRVPGRVRKLGRLLLDQQMWCWGRDIVRPGGNALIAYGFVRERPPEGVAGSSGYAFRPGRAEELRVWGFGFFYAGPPGEGPPVKGLYLGRRGFSPELVEDPVRNVWAPRHLPERRRPRPAEEEATRSLLCGALRRVAEYERWAQRELGPGHREWCVETWHKAAVAAGEMPEAWERLAGFFDTGKF